jgi:hypothetical protein
MNKFDLLTTNSLDLLALIIEGERLRLVPIERKFESTNNCDIDRV